MAAVRPRLTPIPCPVCGTPVDPLRAGSVLLFEDGFRYLCDSACRTRYLAGERTHEASRPRPSVERPSQPPLQSNPVDKPAGPRAAAVPSEPVPTTPPPRPQVPLGACVFAAVIGALAGQWMFGAAISVVAAAAALAWTVTVSLPSRRDVGWFAVLLGPAGALLALASGVATAWLDDDARLPLVGASVVVAALVLRAWLDARGRQPVDVIVAELRAAMPARVRVPVADAANPSAMTHLEIATERVRTGEEILALEGEAVAVDGVVKAGEAFALLHPGAKAAVKRVPGDPLLAGALITQGAVRLLATRVGDNRALVRPASFGSGSGRDAAPVARLASLVTRWGGLAAIAGAASSVLVFEGEGIAAQLAAAGAVLLSASLLAIMRGAESPIIAGAATAAARGIVFRNARAVDTAGRVACAALCTHGTVTTGEPEVVEIYPIGDQAVEPLVALAAAAESVAEGHAIARAVLRFAEARRIAPESVRRATFIPGRGVTALAPGGEQLVIGNRHLLLDEGVSVAVADAEAARAEARGRTVVFVGLGGHVCALLSVEDEIRPSARAAVQRLIDLHVEIVLLSGDHRGTVEALAKQLDIHHVKAELLPDERGAEVRRLREAGGPVATVGRPVYDDAALAAADVPVVVGAAGGPAGERAIALATEDVRDAAAALWIARASRGAAVRAVYVGVAAGALATAAAVLGWAQPPIIAMVALAVDVYALQAGARLLRRIELRLPARS